VAKAELAQSYMVQAQIRLRYSSSLTGAGVVILVAVMFAFPWFYRYFVIIDKPGGFSPPIIDQDSLFRFIIIIRVAI
jgi:hypothetical protein